VKADLKRLVGRLSVDVVSHAGLLDPSGVGGSRVKMDGLITQLPVVDEFKLGFLRTRLERGHSGRVENLGKG